MGDVVFFEICVDDLEVAAQFYSRVFGWEITEETEDPDTWSISTGNGDSLGMPGALTSRFDEWNSTVNTINVESLDACSREVTRAGGKVLAPPTEIAGVGYVQYCHDVEGNVFAILELLPETEAAAADAADAEDETEADEEDGA